MHCCSTATITSDPPSTWPLALCDAAGDFQVLLPAMQLERLPEGVIASPHGEVELRGFPGEVSVLELSGRPVLQAANDTGELWTRTPFNL